MEITEQRELTIPLGIIVEKRKSTHRWGGWIWRPVAVLLNPPEGESWRELIRGEDFVRYHAGNLPLMLHRKETESMKQNLALDQPEIYVILDENPDRNSDFPRVPHVVTASPFHAQLYCDGGDYIIEKVAMPEELLALVQAFVEHHHVEEEFKKRQRDKVDVEEQKFGKTPIFTPRNRQ